MNEDERPLVAPVVEERRKCCHKDKPWERMLDEKPDFSSDITGKREYIWKLSTVKKLSPNRVTFSVLWGMGMAMLDMSIVSVALPTLSSFFNKSSSEIQWISDGYSIFLAAVAIIAGKVGDRCGAVNVNHCSMIGFMLFSVTCTLATEQTYWLIIVSRILQGICASFLMSTTMSLATTLVEPQDIPKAMAWNATIVTCSTALGPFLGGLLLEYTSWHYIFLINVPIGIVGIICTSVFLPAVPKLKEPKTDILGAFFTILFLALLVYGITNLAHYPLAGVVLIVIAIGLIVGFCFWEKTFLCPLMARDVLFNYRVISALMASLFMFGLMGLLTYQTPFLMQFNWGYSPIVSGLVSLTGSIFGGIAGMITGKVAGKFCALPIRLVCITIAFCGVILIACAGYGGIGCLLPGMILANIGCCSYVTTSNTYIMITTPPNSKGTIGGCIQCFRETGFSLAIALSCMFSDTIYKLIWGDFVPSGEHMPRDFAATYNLTFLLMGATFTIFISLSYLLTIVSGCHPYELVNNLRGIPRHFLPSLKAEIEANKRKGLNIFGLPIPKPEPPQTRVSESSSQTSKFT